MLGEAVPEAGDRLHVAVGPVHLPVTMAEVAVGDDERAALPENLRYLGELLSLMLAGVLEGPCATAMSNFSSPNFTGTATRSASGR
jgi:hypothetical protein